MPAIHVPAATFMALTRQAAREGTTTRALASRLLVDGLDGADTAPRTPTEADDIDDAGFPLSMTGAGEATSRAA